MRPLRFTPKLFSNSHGRHNPLPRQSATRSNGHNSEGEESALELAPPSTGTPDDILLTAIATANAQEQAKKERELNKFEQLVIEASEDEAVREQQKSRSDQHWHELADQIDLTIIPYRLDQQSVDQTDRLPLFDVAAGRYCALKAQEAWQNKQTDTYWQWIERGLVFHNFYCLDRFCADKRIIMQSAMREGTTLTNEQPFLNRLNSLLQQANVHGTVGFGLAAKTYYRLGRYRQAQYTKLRKTLPLGTLWTHDDLLQKPHRQDYAQALENMVIAIALEPHSQTITNHALFDGTIMQTCGWVDKDITDLSQLQRKYAKKAMPKDQTADSVIASAQKQADAIMAEMGIRFDMQLTN